MVELELTDIRGYNFRKGQFVIVKDSEGYVTAIFVTSVVQEHANHQTTLSGKVHSTNNPRVRLNTNHSIYVDKFGPPYMGKVVDTSEEVVKFAGLVGQGGVNSDDLLASEMLAYIRTSEESFSRTRSDVIRYMIKAGYFDESETKAKHLKKIEQLCDIYNAFFRRKGGGRIQLTEFAQTRTNTIGSSSNNFKPKTVNNGMDTLNIPVRHVDRAKLMKGIEMILDSGILGEIINKWPD